MHSLQGPPAQMQVMLAQMPAWMQVMRARRARR
jgi:hypothetical protein